MTEGDPRGRTAAPGPRACARRRAAVPPHVRLGALAEGGLAPAILAVVERGVSRRPALVQDVRAEVQLDFDEGYPPVRVVFGNRLVLVEEGPGVAPDMRLGGKLPISSA